MNHEQECYDKQDTYFCVKDNQKVSGEYACNMHVQIDVISCLFISA